MKRFKACISCGCMLEGEDEINRGTCERCDLDRTHARKTPAAVPVVPVPVPAPAGPKKKILLIDDEPLIVKFLTKRLEVNGYEVIVAFDGLQGFAKLKSDNPDLILADILMPNMTGYDLVQKIRRETDGTQKTPIIIMTAKPSMKSFFDEWEIEGFVSKPIVAEELMKQITEILKPRPVPPPPPPPGKGKKR